MRPIVKAPWGGDPHLRLNDDGDSFAFDRNFRFGPSRMQEIESELADGWHDGREPWPSELHRRISRCLRLWLRTHQPEQLARNLVDSQPDKMPWRQLVEDLVIAARGNWEMQ